MDDANLRTLKSVLESAKAAKDISVIRRALSAYLLAFPTQAAPLIDVGEETPLEPEFIASELRQIIDSETIERAQHYINRLLKGFDAVRTNGVNDINLNRWKACDDILTDSLWLIDKRDNSGVHHAGYWGNFVPQIPQQLIRRYTRKGDLVIDPFLGSGTTLIECRRLGRDGLGIELKEDVCDRTRRLLDLERDLFTNDSRMNVVCSDSATVDYPSALRDMGVSSAQLAILHPPYWDIIQFSEDPRDLSNADGLNAFIDGLGKVVDNVLTVIEPKRHLALVIGDKFSKGEWIPLGFLAMQSIQAKGCLLKSVVVKNYEDTMGKRNVRQLWRYRALAGGFYVFKHEYIFIFQKR